MTEPTLPHDPSKGQPASPAGALSKGNSGVTQREVPTADGLVASTGSEASAAYGEGSIQILEGLAAPSNMWW